VFRCLENNQVYLLEDSLRVISPKWHLATYLMRANRNNESIITKHGSSQAWLIPIPQYRRAQQILSNLNASLAAK
jgi:antitoxin (DNA-binding transcriptional repressor) of toxin-antitoxin stability system